MTKENLKAPSRSTPETHQRNESKLSRIPIKVEVKESLLRKPDWIRAKVPSGARVNSIKKALRKHGLYSVCEEASCPNLGECFNNGTATFMIMGDICTRRCPFCDVAHGRPKPLDQQEPRKLAETIKDMALRYVVITSVDRDDLRDGGATHFTACTKAVRELNPNIQIEILVPDFRGRMDIAVSIMQQTPPDVFNHNLETIPRLYKKVRPGSDYAWSLKLLQRFKEPHPNVPTKSGIMLGLGETIDEVKALMQDLRVHQCDMLTLGQYLQPSKDHLAVERYVTPAEFDELAVFGKSIGFSHVASGPMVRSSYHADQQASGVI
jgi:lipoic acid synthetase